MQDSALTTHYSQDYREGAFLLWYKSAKPGAHRLRDILLVNGDAPSVTTLGQWIKEDFAPRASFLDDQVRSQLEQRLVQEKVEMLSRHAKIGKRMQEISMKVIEEEKITSIAQSVRMLVEGVRIERESAGIPGALEKIISKSDEDLLDELQKILEKTPVAIEQIDSEV